MPSDYLPILIFAAVALTLSAVAILVPVLLGPRRPTATKLAPYESGKKPIGPARRRFPIQYYVYAMLFLLFDVALMLLFPWAAVFRDLRPRLTGLLEAALFVVLPALGLFYAWKKEGLEWD